MDANDDRVPGAPDAQSGESEKPVEQIDIGSVGSVDSVDQDATAGQVDEAADEMDSTETQTGESTELAVRRQMELPEEELSHVAALQESLSALAATGAEMAALLNWKTNAYNELTNGLKQILAIGPEGKYGAGYIETSSYVILPSVNEAVQATRSTAGEGAALVPASFALQSTLPVDVTTILSEVEKLTRGLDADSAERAALEQALEDRDVEMGELQQRLDSLLVDVDANQQELADVRERVRALFEVLGAPVPDSRVQSLVEDAWDSQEDFDVRAGLEQLNEAIADSVQQLQAKQDALDTAKRDNASLANRNASLADRATEQEAEARDIAAMVDNLEGMLVPALSEDEASALRSTLASNTGDSPASRIGDFGAIIAAAVTAVRKREKALAQAGEQRTELQEQLAATQDQLQQRDTETHDLQDRLALQQTESRTLREAKSATDDELTDRMQALADLDDRIRGLGVALADVLPAGEASAVDVVSGAEGVEDLAAEDTASDGSATEYDASAAEAGTEPEDVMSALETKVKAVIALLAGKDQAIADADAAQSELVERMTSLQADYVSLESDHTSLETDHASLQSDFEAQSNLASELQMQLDADKDALDTLRQNIDDIRDELGLALAEAGFIAGAEDGSETATGGGPDAATDGEGQPADGTVGALRAKVMAAIALLAAKDKIIDDAEAAQSALGERLTILRTEYDGQTAVAGDLQSQLDVRNQDLDALRSQIDDLRTELGAALAESGAISEEGGDEADDSAAVDGDDVVGALKARVEAAIALLGAKNAAIIDAETAQSAMGERMATLESDYASLQTDHESQTGLVSELQAQLDSRGADLDALRSQIDDIRTELSLALAEAGAAPAEDEEAGDGVAALRAKVSAAIALLAAKQEAIDNAEITQSELGERFASLQVEFKDQSGAASDLQSQLDARNEELSGLQTQIDTVRSTLIGALQDAGVELPAAGGDEEGALSEEETGQGITGSLTALSTSATAVVSLLSDKLQALQDSDAALSSLEAKASDLVGANEKLQAELEAMGQSTADALSRQEGFQSKIAELSDRSSQLDTQVSGLNDALAAMEADKSALADKLAALEAESAQSNADVEAALVEKAAAVEELDGLTAKIADLRAQISSALQEMGEDEALEGLADSQEGEEPSGVAGLAAGVAALVTVLNSKQQTIQASEEDITALGERSTQLGEENQTLQTRLEEAMQAASEAQAQGLELQSVVDELKANKDDLDGEVTALRDQLSQLKDQLTGAETEKEGLAAQLSQLDTDFAQANQDHEAALAEKAAQLDEITNLKSELDGEVSGLKDQLAALKQSLDASETDKSTLADRLSQLQTQFDSANEEHAAALARKTAQIAALTGDHDDLSEQVSSLTARLTRLNERLGETEADRYELQEKLAQLERDFDGSKKEQEIALAEKNEQIARLTQAAAQARASIEDKDKELQGLQSRVDTLQAELNEREASSQDVQAQLRERTAELESANQRLVALDVELATQTEERDALLDTAPVRMVNVPGTWQGPADIECGEWDPGCAQTRLRKRRDGTYRRTFQVPPGQYEVKVAINGNWDENYGAGGQPDGPSIEFRVGNEGEVTFTYDPRTHVLSVS